LQVAPSAVVTHESYFVELDWLSHFQCSHSVWFWSAAPHAASE
jgi:hypothetical protein